MCTTIYHCVSLCEMLSFLFLVRQLDQFGTVFKISEIPGHVKVVGAISYSTDYNKNGSCQNKNRILTDTLDQFTE